MERGGRGARRKARAIFFFLPPFFSRFAVLWRRPRRAGARVSSHFSLAVDLPECTFALALTPNSCRAPFPSFPNSTVHLVVASPDCTSTAKCQLCRSANYIANLPRQGAVAVFRAWDFVCVANYQQVRARIPNSICHMPRPYSISNSITLCWSAPHSFHPSRSSRSRRTQRACVVDTSVRGIFFLPESRTSRPNDRCSSLLPSIAQLSRAAGRVVDTH